MGTEVLSYCFSWGHRRTWDTVGGEMEMVKTSFSLFSNSLLMNCVNVGSHILHESGVL